jgi:ATP-binding cassette subfamily C (CFTR/MRP) protein 1
MSFLIILFNAIYQGFQVGSSVWLTKWSNEKTNPDGTFPKDKRNMYLGVYGALGLALGLNVMIGAIVMSLAMLKAAAYLHNLMLSHVLKSPMSFFDTTPLGRIINRFSKDVDVVDNTLPMNMRSWIQCLFTVMSTIVIISISTPWFLAAILPLSIVYYLITKFYVATSRQLKRLESVSRSPIYSHFNETLTGCTTIRAYAVQDRFILESENKVDFNQKCFFPSIVANR